MAEDLERRILNTTIFSLVVPYKEPVTSHRIRLDYKDTEGEDIPYSDFGYRNLDEFFLAHSMLTGMQQDGKWVFTAKMSERSGNIQALVRGQKSKKSKGKKGGQFGRFNSTRSSYHGRPTLGQGDVRKPAGAAPSFVRTNNTFRSFNTGARAPFIPPPSSLSSSRSSLTSTSSSFSARPPQPWMGNPGRKFVPTLPNLNMMASSSSSSSSSAPFTPFTRCDGPIEGARRINAVLAKCKGVATLRNLCRFYANEFNARFDGEELKKHFKTANLAEIIDKHFNERILVGATPDGSVIFTDKEVMENHERAARELAERKKNNIVIEPAKKHCAIPSLKGMYDEMAEMLIDAFPRGIPLADITSRYEERAGVRVEPEKVFMQPWDELIPSKFSARIKIEKGEAVLTPSFIKANNLHAKASGERQKQELVTLAGLGILYVEDSSQEEEGEEEDEEGEGGSERANTPSLLSVDVASRSGMDSWRNPTTGYNSMNSSMSSIVQQCNLMSPPDLKEGATESASSAEMDELTEVLQRTIRQDNTENSPRRVTIAASPSTSSSAAMKSAPTPSPAPKSLSTRFGGIGEEDNTVAERATPLAAVRGWNFSTPSRRLMGGAATPMRRPAVAVPATRPDITMNPKEELKMAASGAYTSFSFSLNTKDTYAYRVTCENEKYTIFGKYGFTRVNNEPKIMQVLLEEGPAGRTTISIAFVKREEDDTRQAAVVFAARPAPDFVCEYEFVATQ